MGNKKRTPISLFRITLVLTLIHGLYLFYMYGTDMFYMYYPNKFVFFQQDQLLLFSSMIPKEITLSFTLPKVIDILFVPLLFFAYFLVVIDHSEPEYNQMHYDPKEMDDDNFISLIIVIVTLGIFLVCYGIAINLYAHMRLEHYLDIYIFSIYLVPVLFCEFYKLAVGQVIFTSEQENTAGLVLVTPIISLLFINFFNNNDGNSITLSLLVSLVIVFPLLEFLTFVASQKSTIVFLAKKIMLLFTNFGKWLLFVK